MGTRSGDVDPGALLAIQRAGKLDPDALDELLNEPGKFVAAGFGWQRFPPLLDANLDYLAGTSSVLYPTARHLLPEGRRLYEKGGAIEPQDVVPAYLRQTVARPRADADP